MWEREVFSLSGFGKASGQQEGSLIFEGTRTSDSWVVANLTNWSLFTFIPDHSYALSSHPRTNLIKYILSLLGRKNYHVLPSILLSRNTFVKGSEGFKGFVTNNYTPFTVYDIGQFVLRSQYSRVLTEGGRSDSGEFHIGFPYCATQSHFVTVVSLNPTQSAASRVQKSYCYHEGVNQLIGS